MDLKNLTVKSLVAHRPDLVESIAKCEQNRILTIQAIALDGMEFLVADAINHYLSVEDAHKRFMTTGPIERRARYIWKNSPEVRAEYQTEAAFVAFCKADEKGMIKISMDKR